MLPIKITLYKYIESVNELLGYGGTVLYADGKLEVATNKRRISGKAESVDEAFSYVPYYDIYYLTIADPEITCPESDSGIHTITRIHSDITTLSEVYANLKWAFPQYIYQGLYFDGLKEEFTFDEEGKMTEIIYYVYLCSAAKGDDERYEIEFRYVNCYDDFEITAEADFTE